MTDRASKDALFDGFAAVGKALASGRRAEIVDLLVQGGRNVEEIAAEIGQSVANTSFHLRSLALAGLVTTRRDGNHVRYALASDRVAALWSAVRDVARAHHAELDHLAGAYLGRRQGIEEIPRDELTRRLSDGDVVLIDVRPDLEYESGHIAGARSVPVDELALNLDALPADTEVVAYCRGPFCVFADDAVRLLQQSGRAARRLEDGYPEWRGAGLPTVEASSSGSSPK